MTTEDIYAAIDETHYQMARVRYRIDKGDAQNASELLLRLKLRLGQILKTEVWEYFGEIRPCMEEASETMDALAALTEEIAPMLRGPFQELMP